MNAENLTLDPYPIEVDFPDITPYAIGNCGIPYLYTFDSKVSGPHLMINALTHGNEVCGAIVVKALLDQKIRPRCGRLTLSFANVDAYHRFNTDVPDASRFIDQDFNRIWTAELLDDNSKDSLELRRARLMRPAIDTVDLLLDLHSMHERSAPLIVSGALAKGIELGKTLGEPADIVADKGHAQGCRLRDYSGFGDESSKKNALLVECGQHWEASVEAVAKSCTAKFLILSQILNKEDLPENWYLTSDRNPRVINVTDAVVANSMDFQFSEAYTGLEKIASAGTVIAWNNSQPVLTPYDNCILIMPSLRQLDTGVTVVRFGRQWEPSCL